MVRAEKMGTKKTNAYDPKMYLAWPPNYNEQIAYLRQGAVAALFIASLFVVAWGVS